MPRFNFTSMPLDVIPVIDLLGGQVVRGVAGRRSEYRPVVSTLCDNAAPVSVAAAFACQFGFREAYVADLDAIQGRPRSWASYEAIAAAGMRLLLDDGIADAEAAGSLWNECGARGIPIRVVVGLETLHSLAELEAITNELPADQLVFSLDLKQGRPLTNSADLDRISAIEIADRVVDLGIHSMIVLDLAAVGVGQGVPTLELCRQIASRHSRVSLIAGGGVRGSGDLLAIERAGCRGALVASALHDGTLTPDQLPD